MITEAEEGLRKDKRRFDSSDGSRLDDRQARCGGRRFTRDGIHERGGIQSPRGGGQAQPRRGYLGCPVGSGRAGGVLHVFGQLSGRRHVEARPRRLAHAGDGASRRVALVRTGGHAHPRATLSEFFQCPYVDPPLHFERQRHHPIPRCARSIRARTSRSSISTTRRTARC